MDIQNEFIGAVYSGNLAEITALIKRGAKIGEDEITKLTELTEF